jgi:hypothetical protein
MDVMTVLKHLVQIKDELNDYILTEASFCLREDVDSLIIDQRLNITLYFEVVERFNCFKSNRLVKYVN